MLANTADGFLLVERVYAIVEEQGVVSFRVTNQLDFGTQDIPSSKDALLGRTQPMQIEISDTGAMAHSWQVMATETAPLSGPTTVHGAFVYTKGGKQVRLNGQDQYITSFDRPGGMLGWSEQLDFPEDEGIMLNVNPSDVLAGAYSGVITWTLVDA